jgi:hypothetical protein
MPNPLFSDTILKEMKSNPVTKPIPKHVKKSTRTSLTDQQKCTIRALHQVSGLKVRDIIAKNMQLLKNVSKSAIYKEAKIPLDKSSRDLRIGNKSAGRPTKLNGRDHSRIDRTRKYMRKQYGSFDSLDLQETLGMMTTCSNRTFRNHLHRMGVKWLQSKRKGVLTDKDKKERVAFARNITRTYGQGDSQLEFWRNNISMYTDIVGFEYKRNPFAHSQTPQAREWRRQDEALEVTRKGQKEGKNQVRFLVGIGHNRGVSMVEDVAPGLNGQKFASIIKHGVFEPGLGEDRTIVQDNCPVQNSKVACKAFTDKNIKRLKIPPRSPDLNAIENLFNQMRPVLRKSTIEKNIMAESKEQFRNRCVQALGHFSLKRINNLIDSYPRRIAAIIKSKGHRTKY